MQNIYQRKSFYSFIYIMCFLNLLGITLAYIYGATAITDEIEHLRASWFVSQGYLPYRDFFEHHHPLIWFIWAPMMKILPQQIDLALYLARFVSVLFSIGSTTVYFFLIKRFFGGTKNACLALCFYFIFYVGWYAFYIFKPDTFSRFFYLLGLYQFFAFCQNKKTKDIFWCGINFTISFLFLQTIIFSIIPLFFPVIWLIYKKRTSFRTVCFSAIIPLLILGGAVLFLYVTNSLSDYFQLNWIFNRYLFKVTPFYLHDSVINFYGIYILLTIISSLWLFFKNKTNFNQNVLILLFTGEICHLLCFSAEFPHYFIYLFLFSAAVFALVCNYITDSIFINMIKFCFITSFFLNLIILSFSNNIHTLKMLHLIENSENKSILNCHDLFYVWEPLHHYYWFYPYMSAIDSVLFNRYPEFDINNYLQSYKIEYIHMQKNLKCFVDLKEEVLPQDNLKNAKNFVIKPEIYDKYEEIDNNLFKIKPTP